MNKKYSSAAATPSAAAYSAAPTAYVQGAPQTYNTQRTGYEQAYSAATANAGTYGGKNLYYLKN